MEENMQARDELSLSEIFRILLRKLKFLFLALLGGLIVGAGIGTVTTLNVDYYGVSAEFYVNPIPKETQEGSSSNGSQFGFYGAYGATVMDSTVKLLNSDLFAEALAFGGQKLPEVTDDEGNLIARNPIVQAELELALDIANVSKMEEGSKTEGGLTREEEEQRILSELRETAIYRQQIRQIKNAVEFSFYTAEDAENMNNLAKSFIYMEISVLNGEEFAKDIFERVKTVLPGYVMEKMPLPDGYKGTNCQYISTLAQVSLLNPNYTFNSAIKYGLILGAAALVVACVIVVLVDRSDKRLRNYELTMAKFNVPVLGVIPTMNHDEEKSSEEGSK